MPANSVIQLRRGTAAQWTSMNPVLADGEPGYETDTGKEKRGDGTTAWASLAYFASGSFVRLDLGGAKGDGTTDDVTAINAVLAAAPSGSTVVGDPKATYLVGISQTASSFAVPSGTSSMPVCVVIPNGVTLDLRGATLKLKAATDAVLVTSAGTTTNTTNTNVGLVGAKLDGNNVTLTSKFLVQMAGITGLKLDLKLSNVNHGGVQLHSCSQVDAPRLEADTVTGQPFAIGSNVSGKGVTDSRFGLISARNVSPDPANTFNFPGNSFYCEMQKSTIDTIRAYNCTAGIKIGTTNADLAIGKIAVDTCGDSGGNSGVKFQGDGTAGPYRISVGQIVAKNQQAHGLWMEKCTDCSVGTYIGEGNQILGGGPDIWVGGTRDQIGTARSKGAGQIGLLVRLYAVNYQIGSLSITNPGSVDATTGGRVGLSLVGTTFGTINSIAIVDDRGTPLMYRGIDVTSTTAILRAKNVYVSGFTNVAVNITGGSPLVLTTSVAGNPLHGAVDYPSGAPADVQVFTSGGTWSKPSSVKVVQVTMLAGGGGGGSGRRSASGTAASGGSAGGGGGYASATFDPAELGSTESVTVGAAGTGGAAQTSDSTNGNNGGNGGATAFGLKLRAQPGTAGQGGTTSSATSGSGGSAMSAGAAGGAGNSTTGGSGGTGAAGAPGGGGGGGFGGTPSVTAGGAGGLSILPGAVSGGAGGTGDGGNGTAGTASASTNLVLAGSGGGGGAAGNTAAGGTGAAGGKYGAGGGGGGGSLNTFASGAGGAGAAGIVVVVSWF